MTGRVAHRPRDIADCVSAYLREGDLDGVVSMFHPDCQVFSPPDQPPLTGRTGAREAFEGFLELKPVIRSDVLSEVIVDDIALVHASRSVVARDSGVIAEGRSVEVAKTLEHGGWGYLIDGPNGPPDLRSVLFQVIQTASRDFIERRWTPKRSRAHDQTRKAGGSRSRPPRDRPRRGRRIQSRRGRNHPIRMSLG